MRGWSHENGDEMPDDITAVLIDDEPWSLLGMKRSFPWKRYGFVLVAESTDPVEAVELICRYEPDVVFTDIRMPEISGMELIDLAMHHGIDAEFVLISGYGEFTYAQHAIRLGVFDYCLKPVPEQSADELLERLSRHVRSKHTARLLDPDGEVPSNRNTNAYRANQVVVVRSECPTFETGKVIQRSCPGAVASRLGRYEYAFLLETRADASHWVAHAVRKDTDVIACGLSRFVPAPVGPRPLLREAQIASLYRFADASGRVWTYSPPDLQVLSHPLRSLEEAIDRESRSRLEGDLHSLRELIEGSQGGIELATAVWNRIAAHLQSFVDRHQGGAGAGQIPFLTTRELVRHYHNLAAMISGLHEWILRSWQRDSLDGLEEGGQQRMKALVRYVDRSFAQPLYLEELAEEYEFNYSYCSELFKRVTGRPFTTYVRQRRVDQAKRLLTSTDEAIMEIAEKVGFEDQGYFSRVFRSITGISPSVFRETQSNANEG